MEGRQGRRADLTCGRSRGDPEGTWRLSGRAPTAAVRLQVRLGALLSETRKKVSPSIPIFNFLVRLLYFITFPAFGAPKGSILGPLLCLAH